MAENKIKYIKVKKLQDMFDYEIDFTNGLDSIILIAPNGCGKTALLSLIYDCIRLKVPAIPRHTFEFIDIHFDDGSRWNFNRIIPDPNTLENWSALPANEKHRRRFPTPLRPRVEIKMYDKNNKIEKNAIPFNIQNLPIEIIADTIERYAPVSRESKDTFFDYRTGERLDLQEMIDRYEDIIMSDNRLRKFANEYGIKSLRSEIKKKNCVFIETQRLLTTKRNSHINENESEAPEEEILRQAKHLSNLLKSAHASYASASQSLDRTFPTRLIQKSEKLGPRETSSLKSDLKDIEARRKSLTDAGILVEDAEYLIAPKDEFPDTVLDALAIYVEDSKKKLSSFDDIFSRVSIFRELLSKKMHPKTLHINKEKGAEIKRGNNTVELDKLSSGEKHEFIMLFKLVFETPENSLVLIDEPEISLHVTWQLEFMNDLQRIQNAAKFQCIIATHSPQIIQGQEYITVDLAEQIQ